MSLPRRYSKIKIITQRFSLEVNVSSEHRTTAAEALDNARIPDVRSFQVHTISRSSLSDAKTYLACFSNVGSFLRPSLSAYTQAQSWVAEDELKQILYDHGLGMSSGCAFHDEIPEEF